jgi:ABC-2 type transport system ATP-binding protein
VDEIVISVGRLVKRYGNDVVVRGIDLDIARGEVFALLGPNGAGKTTTIEILEGLRPRTEGDVRVLGVDPADAGSTWRSRVGVVLQSARLEDEVTVDEVIRHFAAFYPHARELDEVLALVGLEAQRDHRLPRLSGGQRRRVEVALGIVGRPELLFLDEPTTGLDPGARRRLWALVKGLTEEGTTIVLTTHYLEEAEHLADRVGVLLSGRLVDVAPPAVVAARERAAAVVHWREHDRDQEVETDRPTAVVAELGARFGGEVPDLTVTRPSLEDAYLALIGGTQ